MNVTKAKIKKYWVIFVIILVAGITAGVIWAQARSKNDVVDVASLGAYKVERRDLTISVREKGVVQARQTIDVTCQVEGASATVIYLIEEGTILTDEDVANGTILVELDSSKLKDDFLEIDMDVNEERADYVEALRDKEIQMEQNTSDIMAAKLNEEFALMDLKKYLGAKLTAKIMEENQAGGELFEVAVEVANLEDDPNLLGEALQRLRELRNAIEKAQEDIQRAESKLAGTRKLFESNYVTKMELDADTAAFNQAQRTLESRLTALQLFRDYEFIKQAKQLLSDYQESQRQTVRTEAMASAKMAQVEARVVSRKISLEREEEKWERIRKSLDACVVRAPAAGVVIYSKEGRMGHMGSSSNVVELGGTVRHRQKLISIPSTHEMVVQVKIRETNIDMVRVGQPALISLDAYPGELFTGEVYEVARMPSSQDRFMSSSDVKVYETMVSIDGVHPEIRDGMNASVEIIVDQLEGVVCAPVQAVASVGDKKFSYVLREDGSQEERIVEVGVSNSYFIEIKDGLSIGDLVSLIPQRQAESTGQMEEQKKQMIEKALEGRGGGSPGFDMGGERSMRGVTGEGMDPEAMQRMLERAGRGRERGGAGTGMEGRGGRGRGGAGTGVEGQGVRQGGRGERIGREGRSDNSNNDKKQ